MFPSWFPEYRNSAEWKKAIPNPLVLYHADCSDGLAAAWAAHCIWRDSLEAIPVRYGFAYPKEVAGRDVFLLDFAYPLKEMREIASLAKTVTVLDHHQTAKDRLQDFSAENVFLLIDTSRAGCQVTWDTLWAYQYRPWLIQVLGGADLWDFSKPGTKAAATSLHLRPKTFAELDEALLEKQAILEEGQYFLRCIAAQVEEDKKKAFPVSLAGHIVPGMNATRNISELGETLARNQPFAVLWEMTDTFMRFSLRSDRNGEDVAKVAEMYGGGGHPSASGFQMEYADFLEWTKSWPKS